MQGRVFQGAAGRGKPWSFSVELPRTADGRRKQRLKGWFRTKADAERALAEVVGCGRERYGGWSQPDDRGEYLQDWLADTESSLRPTTEALYRSAVVNWIEPRLGAVFLQKLTPKQLQDLYNELLRSGRTDGAWHQGWSAVREWQHDGSSNQDNAGVLCRFHNRWKTNHRYRIRRDPDGTEIH